MTRNAGRPAALIQSAATIGGVIIGVLIVRETGAANASLSGAYEDRIAAAVPLLIAAEVIKLISAAAFAVMAVTLWSDRKPAHARWGCSSA